MIYKINQPKHVIAINRQLQTFKEKLQIDALQKRLKQAEQRNAEFEERLNNTKF